MRILIISDLHIGNAACCLSLVPEGQRDKCKIVDRSYLDTFNEFLKKYDGKFDYLLILGDMANEASPEEFKHFNLIVDEIVNILDLDLKDVFFTIGNHDANWKVFKDDESGKTTPEAFREMYTPLEESEILKQRLSDSKGHLLESPFYCIWENDDIIVVSINTACMDAPAKKPHCGEIIKKTVDLLDAHLDEEKIKTDARVKILLMHHHPVNYENIVPDWKDFSILQCYKDIVDLLKGYRFDFIVHGHRHQPKLKSELNSRGEQLAIICSGSFSHLFPTYVYSVLSNQFHVLEIDDRDDETGVLFGKLLNFAYSLRDGWQPSVKSYCGIEAKLSFGPNEHKDPLLKDAENFIVSEINSKGVCKVFDMIKKLEKFRYKDDGLVKEIVGEICNNHGFDFIGENINNCVVLADGDS